MLSSVVLVVVEDGMGVFGSSVGDILGSSLGVMVEDGFSCVVSLSAASGIRVVGVTVDAEKLDIDSVLVD